MRGAILVILLAPGQLLFAQTGCPVMNAANTYIAFRGASSNCSESGAACMAGESITFTASNTNNSFSCALHTFTWSLGGQPGSGNEVTVSFPFAGTYPVTLTVNNGIQTFTTSMNVVVGPLSCGASQSLSLTTDPAQPTSATPITLHFMLLGCNNVVAWSLDGNVIALAVVTIGSCIGTPAPVPRTLLIGNLPAGHYIVRTTFNGGMIDPIASACGEFVVADAEIPALDGVTTTLLGFALAAIALVALRRV
jgi:hypothetical protein